MRDIATNETIIVGAIIEVKRKTIVDEEFKGIFKGHTEVTPGNYCYWYPVKNTTYSRMVNKLKTKYKMRVKYGIAGTMEL